MGGGGGGVPMKRRENRTGSVEKWHGFEFGFGFVNGWHSPA